MVTDLKVIMADKRRPGSGILPQPTRAKADIDKSMQEKEKLEADPSILKIISGIALIFLLAGMGKLLFRKKKATHD